MGENMPAIDLSKLAKILSEDQSDENINSVYRKIDRLPPSVKPHWTESITAIASICVLLFGLLAAGFTGYLNLKEPLIMVIHDVQKNEENYKAFCSRLSKLETKVEHTKDIIEHDSIRIEYSVDRTKSRLAKIEKFISTVHGPVVLEGD